MKKQPELTDATRQRILTAFWNLFSRKDIAKITVNQLSTDARIHRSSFYRYFSDVYAVLELFEYQLLRTIRNEIGLLQIRLSANDFHRYAVSVASILASHADMLYRLFCGSCGNQFKQLFIASLREEIVEIYGLQDHTQDIDYYATLMGSILMTNLIYWYENQARYSFQEILLKSQAVVKDGLINLHSRLSRVT